LFELLHPFDVTDARSRSVLEPSVCNVSAQCDSDDSDDGDASVACDSTRWLLHVGVRIACASRIALKCDVNVGVIGRDHTTLETPVLVRSPKLSNVGPG
jgi:hypothetical protein